MSAEENFASNVTHGIVEKLLFSWYDYTLFALMLGISAAIGVYFGFFGKKQDTVTEYILGGKNMNTLPIAMSLIASDISAMAFIGVPADIYLYGASYWLMGIAMAISGAISYYVFLPVLYKLQFTSCFEYLKHRFDDRNCMFASFLIVFSMFLQMPLIIYIPSLAFSQVTEINVHMITPIVCVICIFYTTLGGLKAVVWTDTIQLCIMSIAMVIVFVLGFVKTGGPQYVFEKSYEGGRLSSLWNFDLDPTNRSAFWSPVVGMSFSCTAYIIASQVCNQKLQALPTFGKVKWAMVIYIIGIIIIRSISTMTGLIIYAKYADCDPITTQSVGSADQLFPYYMMDVTGKIPGLPGLFIAGIFCAALSTLSTELNTFSGLAYEDFLKHLMPPETTEKRASDIMKIIVVVMGVYATGMVYIVEHLGTLFSLAISLGELAVGPLMAMFTLGILVPVANSKGTIIGAVSGFIFMGWIVFGAQYHTSQGGVITPKLPTSVEECDFSFTALNLTTTEITEYTPPWIYRISFYYYNLIGMIVSMIIAVIASIFTGGREQKVNRDLLSPMIYFLLPKEESKEYKSDDVILKTIEKNESESETL